MRHTVLPAAFLLGAVALACDRPASARNNGTAANSSDSIAFADTATVAKPAWLDSTRMAEERVLFDEAARAAWQFVNRNYVASTGLIRPFDSYSISTMWDIASGLAALFCARELGLLEAAEYDRRMGTALHTLSRLPLFEDIAFNKEYAVESGQMIGLERTPSKRGYGISATDMGRLLLWLQIIAQNHPQFGKAAGAVAARVRGDQMIDDGYLIGRQISRRTNRVRTFQEGRIGYEQYAAAGFQAWGHRAEKALDLGENAEDVEVSGVRVRKDKRGADRLTSEPFVLLGLEYGWNGPMREAAQQVLAAQEARAKETGRIVMVSEDAINIPPDYFFYYTVYSRHGPWSIDVQRPGVKLKSPRWVSSKAALGWHALLPGDYTRSAVDLVRTRALNNGVWGAGVLEDGRPAGNPNLNTASAILEAALYRQRGAPLIRPAAASAARLAQTPVTP